METMAELRESLEKQFQERADRETQASKEEALVEALLDRAEIDIPETLLEREVQTMLTQTAIQMENYGMDISKLFTAEMMPQLKERSRPEASERLRSSLALEEVAKREGLKPEEEAIEAKIKEVMEELAGQPVDRDRVREVVESDLLREHALKWLEEHATIELVPKGTLAAEVAAAEELALEEAETEATAETPETEAAAQTVEVEAEPSPEEEAETPETEAAAQTIEVEAEPSPEEE
jgi:trigger factor